MAQFLAVAISLYFIYRQIRIQTHSNMLSTFAELERRWNGSAMLEARRTVCSDNSGRLQIHRSEELILGFFEDLGLYLRREIFDADLLWELHSYYVEHYWPLLQPRIARLHTETKDETWYSNFDYLARRLSRISKRKGVRSDKTPEQIQKFCDLEVGSRVTALTL